MLNFIHKFIVGVAVAVTAFVGAFSSKEVVQNPVATTSPQIVQIATTTTETVTSTSTSISSISIPKKSSVKIPVVQKGTLCNGTYYSSCSAGSQLVCPTDGEKASCQPLPNIVTPVPAQTSQSQSTNNVAPLSQTISPNTNSQDLSDFYSFVDQAISGLNNAESQVQSFNSRVRSDITGIGSSVPAIASLGNQTLPTGNALISDIEGSISTLRADKSQAMASGSVNMQYWRNTGVQSSVNDLKNYMQQLLNLENSYSQSLLQINQSTSQSTYTPQTTQSSTPDLYSEWSACLLQMKQIDSNVRSSGSCFLESQCEAVTIKTALSQGLPCANSYY